MKINDVEKITGLTQKAIRLYEDRGLIRVTGDDNGYRNYSVEDVEPLKRIKLFRSIGVSVADIKLCLCGGVSVDEWMDKRMAEILKESGRNSESYRICEAILNKTDPDALNRSDVFTEGDKSSQTTHGALGVGVDIGTTTVSAVIYDLDNKEEIEAYSLPHNSYIFSDIRSEQSVSIIMEKSEKLLYHILESYQGIVSIGLSCQVHGIVYRIAEGNAVSELINWQNKRADRILAGGESVCRMTGENISTGYGLATHYYAMLNGEVPARCRQLLQHHGFLWNEDLRKEKNVVHTSNAASFGLFDLTKNNLMKEKLEALDGKLTCSVYYTAKNDPLQLEADIKEGDSVEIVPPPLPH